MTDSKKSQRRRMKYVGGMAVDMVLPSKANISVAPGDVIELLASDAEALSDRPDWAPAISPKGTK